MLKNNIILIVIFLLAFFFRTWNVTSNPPSLYWDEVSQAYNAYAILTTGYDEHHEFLPIARFRAFGDNKAPVYIYLTALAMMFIGKTTFTIRFASVFFGSLTIVFTYLLTRELFYSLKKREYLALLVAFLLAISPWHIFLSRGGYEGNIATFFTVLGVYLFFYAKRTNAWFYTLSAVSFVIGIYAFNAQRIFIPLLIILLIILFYKDLLTKKKQVIIAGLFALILLIPMIQYLTTTDSKIRFAEVNIFSDPGVVTQSNSWLVQDKNSLVGKIFDNRRIGYTLLYAKHYFDFFNPQYLFFTGDVNPRFSSQSSGELWLWELPFILFGLYNLAKFKNKITIFILLWFILAPVAAATARETPHALRSETYIPVYEILTGLGIFTAFIQFRKNKIFLMFGILIGIYAIFQAVYLFNAYTTLYPVKYSNDWQYGYQEAITKAEKMQGNFDTVAFTDTYGRAYVYYLYYANIPVQTYWREGNPTADAFGLYSVTKVGDWQFRGGNIEQANDKGKKMLYVASPQQMEPDLRVVDQVNFLNGDPAFIFAVKK